MAEGTSAPTSLDGGSDALVTAECIQCKADGSKEEASHVCQTCHQVLCHTCGRYHVRNVTSHQLIDISSFKQSTMQHPPATPVTAKCHYHPDREVEMYCGTHDMVYCIAKGHRSCSDVKEIAEVSHDVQYSALQSLEADIARINKLLLEAKLKKSRDLKSIEKMKEDLLKEIVEIRQRINKHLDKLEGRVVAELDATIKKLEREISTDVNIVEDLISTTSNSKPDPFKVYSQDEIFVAEKMGRVVIQEATRFLKEMKKSENLKLSFEANGDLCEAVQKSVCIGKIIRHDSKPNTQQKPTIKRRKYTMKTKGTVYTGMNNEKSDEFCTNGICQLLDGTVVLIDNINNRLKRRDDKLERKDFYTFKDRPMGICSVSPTEVAVRLANDTIQFIQVGEFLTYQRQISLSVPEVNDGMAYCKDQFWIPSKEAVYIYSMTGTLVKQIQTDYQDREIFPNSSPHQISVSSDEERVFVAAGDNRVVVFNSEGDVINEIRDHRLNDIRAVCTTDDGVVFVADYFSSSPIVMFDTDGNCLGHIVKQDKPDQVVSFGLQPLSLCYNTQKHQLMAGNYNQSSYQNTVSVLTFSV